MIALTDFAPRRDPRRRRRKDRGGESLAMKKLVALVQANGAAGGDANGVRTTFRGKGSLACDVAIGAFAVDVAVYIAACAILLRPAGGMAAVPGRCHRAWIAAL
jgi:hypothetical protein